MSDEIAKIPDYEELAQSVDEARWGWVRAHNERGNVLIIDSRYDLVKTGVMIASDETDNVREMIESGGISKPTIFQVSKWNREDEDKKFLILIISPYILLQELPEIVQ